jgi:acyl carrier protein
MAPDEIELRAGVYEALLASSRHPMTLDQLHPDLALADLGIDSLGVMTVLVELESRFRGDLASLDDVIGLPRKVRDVIELARRLTHGRESALRG